VTRVAPAASRVPDRILLAVVVTLVVVLVATVLVALMVWHTPAMHPVPVPSVPRA
jgi:hypothetical protein